MPAPDEQVLLESVQVQPLEPSELRRCNRLLDDHHYLKSARPVGERLYCVASDAQGQWLALLVFGAAAKHLKHRDKWIGWTAQQQRRRLSLVVNNSRFLLLPDPPVPNLGTRVLRLVLNRLSADWQKRYGHRVLIVETFVDPEQFCGTVYWANGWTELGKTDGWGRHQRDYYVKHDQPKRLFVRELGRQARRSLQAEHLKPDLAVVESKVPPPCPHTVKEIRSMVGHFKPVPEFRARIESYPLWSLLTIMLLAVLCGAPRGQKDLAKFARGLSQAQRHASGIRRNRQGRYPSPSQSTYCRLMQGLDERKVEAMIWALQEQVRGKPPAHELIALDGKETKHGGGQGVLSAVSVPSLHYLGSAIVDTKTNEIPVARQLFQRLDLEGRFERRTIRTDTVSAEQVSFPLAAQAARLLREVTGRNPERVCLLTSAEPQRLDAQQWLQLNRLYWGVASGLHQRNTSSVPGPAWPRARTPRVSNQTGHFPGHGRNLFSVLR